MIAKFHFFSYVAGFFKSYLVSFQTESPMVPFVSYEIEKLFRRLCRLVLKLEVVDETTTPYKLIKINFSDKKTQKEYMKINIGIAVTYDLRDFYIKFDIKKSFMKEYFNTVVDILIGLQERSLKYGIIRNASAISPVNVVSKKEDCVLKFQGLVDVLFRKKRLSAKSADNCKQQYDEFLEDVQFKHKENSLKFNYLTNRLDDFLCPFLADEKKYENLCYVCKIVMILSHGQSSIERGFSINKEILDNNLLEKSLISQCSIYDNFTSEHSVLHECVTPQALIKSCNLANGRYKLALEDSKKETVETEESRNRKLN